MCTDGVTGNEYELGYEEGICMTNAEVKPSLTVQLGDLYEINRIFIYNRDTSLPWVKDPDMDIAHRLKFFKLEIFAASGKFRVWKYYGSADPGFEIDIPIPEQVKGDTVKLSVTNYSLQPGFEMHPLHIREIEVYGRQ